MFPQIQGQIGADHIDFQVLTRDHLAKKMAEVPMFLEWVSSLTSVGQVCWKDRING